MLCCTCDMILIQLLQQQNKVQIVHFLYQKRGRLMSLFGDRLQSQLYNNMHRFLKRIVGSFSEIIKHTEKEPENLQSNSIRLSKWLSSKSLCSRREAEQFIKLGLIRIDGKRVYQNMLVPLQSSLKAFTPLGLQIAKPLTKLWMINKPRGYICTHRDPQKRKTVYELFPKELGKLGYLMSVGRLDFNSQGLLLVTNDNTLKTLLEHPDANLLRIYRVKVHGRVTEQKLKKLNSPFTIKDVQYGPLNVNVDRELSTNIWMNVSMRTGKNREIRRIMQKCDLQVNKLVRTQYGPYKLGSLQHGQIAEIPISTGLQRKLKLTKAKELRLKAGSNCLIEVDIRDQAIGLAKTQYQTKKLQEKPQQKASQKTKLLEQEEEQQNEE